jgi:hypothetical protein
MQNAVYTYLPMKAARPAQLILLDLSTIISFKEYKLWCSPHYAFLTASWHFIPLVHIFSTVLKYPQAKSFTLSNATHQVSHPYKTREKD